MLLKSLRQLGHLLIATLISIAFLQLSHQLFFFDLPFLSQLTALWSNLLFVLQASLILAVPLILLGLLPKVGKWLGIRVFTLFVLVHFALLTYLLNTGIPLGADLFGYSIQDIEETISASASFNYLSIVLLIISLFLLVYVSRKALPERLPKYITWVPLLSLFAWLLPHPSAISYNEATYYKVYSPAAYFWTKTYSHIFDKQDTDLDLPQYPFLHHRDKSNPFSSLLKPTNDLPNMVFIAVEGLGADFVGPKAAMGGATPFLDSLINQSLYWSNALSNTGRTFGVLPTLTGSLPYGKEGFMSVGPNFPNHNTLWSWLKTNGYTTSYFYGGNGNFDNQDLFLEAQELDNLYEEGSFPKQFTKMASNETGFSWGYGDRELFALGMDKLKDNPSPHFSFFMTLTTHEPFSPPNDNFKAQIDQLIKEKGTSVYQEYRNVFECLAYTDDALRQFINDYKQTEAFRNTLFVITGDHRLIPVPAEQRLDRFHVPLLIYSPMVVKPQTFENLVTHSQITPAIVNWLGEAYNLPMNVFVSFISPPLKADTNFGSDLEITLMRNKNEAEEYISGLHVLSNGLLYVIDRSFGLTTVNDVGIKSNLERKMNSFKTRGEIALKENRLIPDSLSFNVQKNYRLPPRARQFLEVNNLLHTAPDTLYLEARELAFNRKFDESRIILSYGLSKSPNYHDMRVLLARTYAWNSQPDSAKIHLNETLRRAENYEDAYIAYADVAYWNDQSDLSLELIEKGLSYHPESLELKSRLARSYLEKNKTQMASEIVNEVLKADPTNELANTLQKRIRNL